MESDFPSVEKEQKSEVRSYTEAACVLFTTQRAVQPREDGFPTFSVLLLVCGLNIPSGNLT